MFEKRKNVQLRSFNIQSFSNSAPKRLAVSLPLLNRTHMRQPRCSHASGSRPKTTRAWPDFARNGVHTRLRARHRFAQQMIALPFPPVFGDKMFGVRAGCLKFHFPVDFPDHRHATEELAIRSSDIRSMS